MAAFFRPPRLLALLGIIALLLPFLAPRALTIDIHFRDTYLVLAYFHASWFSAIVFFGLSLVYRAGSRILLSGYISWLHIILTALSLLAILAIPLANIGGNESYVEFGDGNLGPGRILEITTMTAIFFVFVQLVLLANLAGGLLKKLVR